MMKVVLLENIRSLGRIGDVVAVKDGFGKNWLLPQKKALRASSKNLQLFEDQKQEFEKINTERKKDAEKVAAKLQGVTLDIISPAQANGVLYGSITIKDIHNALKNKDITVGKNQIDLHKPIKEEGQHKVSLVLHPEVSCDITLFIGGTKEALNDLMNPEAAKKKETSIETVLVSEAVEAVAQEETSAAEA
ncbi:MAG: 50S ribosomal protein L9 [Alphaproteobacteria bacterium]|nr:MAG: 50S ribosomal protein L9 [Alphaproteobacteria bacterium]